MTLDHSQIGRRVVPCPGCATERWYGYGACSVCRAFLPGAGPAGNFIPTHDRDQRILCAHADHNGEGAHWRDAAEPCPVAFCNCDFDPSFTGGRCDTCGRPEASESVIADVAARPSESGESGPGEAA